jgi:hypothetical protein
LCCRQFEKNKKGVFGEYEEFKLPFEGQSAGQGVSKYEAESFKKIHSLYFPINWKETIVTMERLLLVTQANLSKEFLTSKGTNSDINAIM